MTDNPFLDRLRSHRYASLLSDDLRRLMSERLGPSRADLAVLGIPRFFSLEDYRMLRARHDSPSTFLERFFESVDIESEVVSLALPIRRILKSFCTEKRKDDWLSDLDALLASIDARRAGTQLERRMRDVDALGLGYARDPSRAMSLYKDVFVDAQSSPGSRPALRRAVWIFDEFREEGLFTSPRDEEIHRGVRGTVEPWLLPPDERRMVLRAIYDDASERPFDLLIGVELLKAELKLRELDAAEATASKLEATATKYGLASWRIVALRHMARAYLFADRYDDCARTLLAAEEVFAGSNVDEAQIVANRVVQADLERFRGNFGASAELLDACLAFYDAEGRRPEYANVLFKKAMLENELGNHRETIDLCRRAEPILKGMRDSTGRGNALNSMVAASLGGGYLDDEEVEGLLDKASEEHRRGHSKSGLANSLQLRAKYLRERKGAFDEALRTIDRAVELVEGFKQRDLVGLYNVHMVRAEVLRDLGEVVRLGSEVELLRGINSEIIDRGGDASSFDKRNHRVEALFAQTGEPAPSGPGIGRW